MQFVVKACGLAISLSIATTALGFGGFFAAKTGGSETSEMSKVVFVRDGDKTVVTLMPSYEGDGKDIAFIVPVPSVLERRQIHVGDPKPIARLDAYTAPRLAEYFDENPCDLKKGLRSAANGAEDPARRDPQKVPVTAAVTGEVNFGVGDYDVAILTAEESKAVAGWLLRNGYKVAAATKKMLATYSKSGMKFLVAKVNFDRMPTGQVFLSPLQIAFESKQFELPIRLGTMESKGDSKGHQDLLIFALTRQGRVEVSNYEMEKVPTSLEVPLFVKDGFSRFYAEMIDGLATKNSVSKVYTEFAWDGSWCDPCAGEPLTYDELRKLGVFWASKNPSRSQRSGKVIDDQKVFVTRMRLRTRTRTRTQYDGKSLPQDLKFKTTADRNLFQARYIVRHPFTSVDNINQECPRAQSYQQDLAKRKELQATNLARLTNLPIDKIRKKMALPDEGASDADWIDNLWTD